MAAGDGYKAGRMCKVYLDPMGAGVGTYSRLLIGKDPKLGFEWDEAVVEDDASKFKRYLKGLLDAPLELTMNLKVGDTQYNALQTAALAEDSYVGLAVCTGLITVIGTNVFEADWHVMSFPWDMPIADTATVAVGLKLAANSPFPPALRTVTV